jgi:hypothetical protein
MAGLTYVMANTPTAVTNTAWVIAQITTAAGSPLTIHQFRLQSSALTSGQAVNTVQWGYYATGTSTNTVALPVVKAETHRNTIAAAFTPYGMTATMGTTFTVFDQFQWNIALPWEDTRGLVQTKIEVDAGKAWALILPNASGTPTINCTIHVEEY